MSIKEVTRFELVKDMRPFCEVQLGVDLLLVPKNHNLDFPVTRGKVVEENLGRSRFVLFDSGVSMALSDWAGWLPLTWKPEALRI